MNGTRDDLQSGPVAFGETQASVLLDLLRGLAALVVLGEHWRNLFFVDYLQIPSHRLLWAAPYLLTAAGHQAVVIFFVLSGYLISGSVLRSVKGRRWRWVTYLTHRLVRLWIVIVPGLLFCSLCDTVGLWLHRAPGLYAGLFQNSMGTNEHSARSLAAFFGNLFFLQGIRVPMLGTNGVLWSVADEFWYYMLFPLALLVFLPGRVVARALYCTAFLVACWFVGMPVLIGFSTWLLGTILLWWKPGEAGVTARWLVSGAYVLLFFFLARFRPLAGIGGDTVLGLATVLLIRTLLSARGRAEPDATWVRMSRFLAQGSFTLYVVHMPLLVLLASLIAGGARFSPSVSTLAFAAVPLGITVVAAYCLASVTEFHTASVRAWIERRLGLSEAPLRGEPLQAVQ